MPEPSSTSFRPAGHSRYQGQQPTSDLSLDDIALEALYIGIGVIAIIRPVIVVTCVDVVVYVAQGAAQAKRGSEAYYPHPRTRQPQYQFGGDVEARMDATAATHAKRDELELVPYNSEEGLWVHQHILPFLGLDHGGASRTTTRGQGTHRRRDEIDDIGNLVVKLLVFDDIRYLHGDHRPANDDGEAS